MAGICSRSPRSAIPTILVTNDDGPPAPKSPFLHSFVQALRKEWATDIRVVIPHCQRSWNGKSHDPNSDVQGWYYYTPSQSGNGMNGETLTEKKGHVEDSEEEWIILDGTPASCTNIATQCLYPGQIDLVISGPNYGRNTTSAFILSSGTVGAALEAAANGIPAIAVSYALFVRPFPDELVSQAHHIAIRIIKGIWENGFLKHRDADIYNLNVPLTSTIMTAPTVVWTTQDITRYGRLYVSAGSKPSRSSKQHSKASSAAEAPSADPPLADSTTAVLALSPSETSTSSDAVSSSRASSPSSHTTSLKFIFSPDISTMVNTVAAAHGEGTDAEAQSLGWCTVTPLKASFETATIPTRQDSIWQF